MIPDDWPRIAGVHITDGGEVAVVWMAYERDKDTIHLYDCAIFRREVLAVVAEGINARGRWIPVSWASKAKTFADDLLSRGCRMDVDGCDIDDAMIEVLSRTIWERMRSSRWRVDKRLAEWLDEFKGFQRVAGKVPVTGYPLMAATRIALMTMDRARRHDTAPRRGALYPKVAVL